MGVSGGPYIVRDNSLIFELDTADRNSYAAGQSIWNDLSPNIYNATLVNGPLFSTENNGLLILDGINDYAFTPPESSGSNTGDFTWEVWYRPLNLNTNAYPLTRGRDSGSTTEWSLTTQIASGSGQFSAIITTTSAGILSYPATSSIANGVTASARTWYHIAGTWTAGTRIDLYVNGSLAGTRNQTTTNLRDSNVGWYVGTDNFFEFASGSIAVARAYSRALSADEIRQNYETHAPRFVTGSGTIFTTTTTTTTTTSTTTTTTTVLYSVTVTVGNSATRTAGGISGVYYKLGAGGSKTTLATGITGPDCPTTSTVGTINNIPNGTVLYIGPQIAGTTDQTFGATGCAGSPLIHCGFVNNPYIVTVNSNLTINLNLNVSAGAYTTC